MKIVLSLNDSGQASQLESRFIDDGYLVAVISSQEELLARLGSSEVNCILASLELQNCHVPSLIRRMRQNNDPTPVIVLADEDDTEAKVEILDAGGDDFLVNPITFKELAARVRAVIRRCAPGDGARLEFRDVVMDLASRTVRRGDDTIALTPREFALLEMLMRNQRRVVTRRSIEERVWGGEITPETSNVIDVCISRLRRKLNVNGFGEMIRTVHGLGYSLTDDPAYEGRTSPDEDVN